MKEDVTIVMSLSFMCFSPLVAGNCGLVVHLVGEENVLIPFAMFVGEDKRKPKNGKNIYQAVLLTPNVEDIQEKYASDVTNLRQPTQANIQRYDLCQLQTDQRSEGPKPPVQAPQMNVIRKGKVDKNSNSPDISAEEIFRRNLDTHSK